MAVQHFSPIAGINSQIVRVVSVDVSPLNGVQVVSLAPNLPGPAAAAQLVKLGAHVTKVEAPSGDFMAHGAPDYYAELTCQQRVVTLDLKSDDGRLALAELLAAADIFLTSSRPSALARLGLDWETLHKNHPRLVQVAIVGHPGDDAEVAGHDLTYQAAFGTLEPPAMPRVLIADLGGAERAATAAVVGLFARERTGSGSFHEVALSDVAYDFAAPHRHGLTAKGGVLGGGIPQYAIHETADGYLAVAALEGHFWQRLRDLLGIADDAEALKAALRERSSQEWQAWGRENDVPLAAILD